MKVDHAASSQLKKNVQAYISDRFDVITEDLRTLVRIPSCKGDAAPGCPFGPGPAAALEAAARLYESCGFSVERYPEEGYALARIGSGDRTLGFFCHCDVVPGDTGVWEYSSDPFDLTIRGDYFIGRGVRDDKGAAVAVLHALNALRACGAQPEHSILVFLGSNEETGMEDILSYRERHPLPDVSLVPDCDPPICRGERSKCGFDLTCQRKFETVKGFSGGAGGGVVGEATAILPNTAALKAELTTALAGRTDAVLSENEAGDLVLTATGVTAHSGMPRKSVNAGYLAADILLNCPSLGENDLTILAQVRGMLCEALGSYFGLAFHDEDFGDLYISSSRVDLIDGRVFLRFTCLHNAAVSLETVQSKVSGRAAADGWDCVYTSVNTGFIHPIDHPVVELVMDLYLKLCEEDNVKPFRAYASTALTYARRLKNAFAMGIDVPYTKVPADFLPGHGNVHQPDECLGIPNFKEGILLIALMINALDRELDKLPSAND